MLRGTFVSASACVSASLQRSSVHRDQVETNMQLRSVEPRSCRLTDSAYVPYQRLRAARRIVQHEPAGTYPELEPPIREHAGCRGVIGHHHGMTSVVGKHVSRQAKDRCRIGCCHTSRYRRHVTYQDVVTHHRRAGARRLDLARGRPRLSVIMCFAHQRRNGRVVESCGVSILYQLGLHI